MGRDLRISGGAALGIGSKADDEQEQVGSMIDIQIFFAKVWRRTKCLAGRHEPVEITRRSYALGAYKVTECLYCEQLLPEKKKK